MNDNGNKQIFYSESPRRWLYSKRTIFAVLIFLFSIFGVTVGSIILGPTLPSINLSSPDPVYRAVPNVATPATVTAVPAISQNLTLPAVSNAVVPRPKVLGFYVNWDDNSFVSLKDNLQNIDELVDSITNAIFNDELKLNKSNVYDKNIGSKISYSKNNLISLLYNYKGISV